MTRKPLTLTPAKTALLTILCLIPSVGAVVGVILLINLFFYKNRTYLVLALTGLVVTAAFWAKMIYDLHHRGAMDESRIITAKYELMELVKEIEFFKINNNRLPKSLEEVKANGTVIQINDPMQSVNPKMDPKFYYQVKDSNYYLFSRGFDGIAFTADDLLPNLKGMNPRALHIILER